MSTRVLTERDFAEIIAKNGGRVFRVGDCVRDSLMGRTPKNIDFCIVGMVKKNFKMIFPEAEECSKSISVFRLEIDGKAREAAFARTERKEDTGSKGVKVSTKPKITLEEDLFRRDTTVNSIAVDVLTGEIIDPFHGRKDIEAKVLRATSQHFSNDPLRAVQLAGQSARLGFNIDSETLPFMVAAAEGLAHRPPNMIAAELRKVLSEAEEPGLFFKVLAENCLLTVTFQEMSDLSPDEFRRVTAGLDAVAKATANPKVRFAVFGLVLDKEGLELWTNRMALPGDWLNAALTVRQTVESLENFTPDSILDTINKLRRGSLTIEEFDLISEAANLQIPNLGPLKQIISLPHGEAVPDTLKGKEIGQWLRKKQVDAISKHLLFATPSV